MPPILGPPELGENELADYIGTLYKRRKQDSLVIGSKANKEWLVQLALQEPSMFTSDCLTFMPIEYSGTANLRLDSNIIFYEMEGTRYSLFDQFAVNEGTPIVMKLGTWTESNGVQLEMRMNRWDRRTDLMGATFFNTVTPNGYWAMIFYNEDGTINGSGGWFQHQLFYVTDRLNLSVVTTESIDENKQYVACNRLLIKKRTDICSGGMALEVRTQLTFTIPTLTQPQTLLAAVPTGTAPGFWVYIEVFGFLPWITLFSSLLAISLALEFTRALSQAENQNGQRLEGFVMSCFAFNKVAIPKVGAQVVRESRLSQHQY